MAKTFIFFLSLLGYAFSRAVPSMNAPVSKAITNYLKQQTTAQDAEKELLKAVNTTLQSFSFRLAEVRENQTDFVAKFSAIENVFGLIVKNAEKDKHRVDVLEDIVNDRGESSTIPYSECSVKKVGRLYFDISKQMLLICNGSFWVSAYPSFFSAPHKTSSVSNNCADVARTNKGLQNGHYVIFDKIHSKFLTVYCDLAKGVSYGGDGRSEHDAGLSCKTIKDYWPKQASGKKWINPQMPVAEPFEIYCDFDSFGGGWSLVYSSQDNAEGHNNMQKGTRTNSGITTLDPGNANKKFALHVFEAIESSAAGYNQVMLTGYQDHRNKDRLVKMYFSKNANSGKDFTQFIEENIWKNSRPDCGVGSYRGTEISSGKNISLSWEDRAFVAGAGHSGCSWKHEVWNEIDKRGGHILAPSEWNKAEDSNKQTTSRGACHNKGLFHIFIR